MLSLQAGGEGYVFRYFYGLLTAVKPDATNKQANQQSQQTPKQRDFRKRKMPMNQSECEAKTSELC